MGNLGVKTDRCHRKQPEVAKFGVNLGGCHQKLSTVSQIFGLNILNLIGFDPIRFDYISSISLRTDQEVVK